MQPSILLHLSITGCPRLHALGLHMECRVSGYLYFSSVPMKKLSPFIYHPRVYFRSPKQGRRGLARQESSWIYWDGNVGRWRFMGIWFVSLQHCVSRPVSILETRWRGGQVTQHWDLVAPGPIFCLSSFSALQLPNGSSFAFWRPLASILCVGRAFYGISLVFSHVSWWFSLGSHWSLKGAHDSIWGCFQLLGFEVCLLLISSGQKP